MSTPMGQTPATNATSLSLGTNARVWIGGRNLEAKRAIASFLAETRRPPRGPLDAAVITPKTTDEAVYFAVKLAPRLETGGAYWVVCPQPIAGEDNEMASLGETITAALAKHAFVHIEDVAIEAGYRASRYARRPTLRKLASSPYESARSVMEG